MLRDATSVIRVSLCVSERSNGFRILALCRNSGRSRGYDFRILDRNKGAGWDLAIRLTRRRNGFNRGRLSASQVSNARG